MIVFQHKIKDELGLHARPAGILVKLASQFSSEITLANGEKIANAKKLFNVMALGTKGGNVLTVSISGVDEQEAREAIENYLYQNV